MTTILKLLRTIPRTTLIVLVALGLIMLYVWGNSNPTLSAKDILLAGSADKSGDTKDGLGTASSFDDIAAAGFDLDGNILVTNNRFFRNVSSDGLVTTRKLNGEAGFLARAFSYDSRGVLYAYGVQSELHDGHQSYPPEIERFDNEGKGHNLAILWPSNDSAYSGLEIASNDRLLIYSDRNEQLISIDKDGKLVVVAGDGKQGYRDGSAAKAEFGAVSTFWIGNLDDVYLCDFGNLAIRKLTSSGSVTTDKKFSLKTPLDPAQDSGGCTHGADGEIYIWVFRGRTFSTEVYQLEHEVPKLLASIDRRLGSLIASRDGVVYGILVHDAKHTPAGIVKIPITNESP